MGWLFPYGATRQSLVEDRTKAWERQVGEMLVRTECLKHCVRGGRFRFVLWTVWRRTFMVDGAEVRPEERWIGCDLCQYSKDSQGFGFKDLTEAEHPFYYSVPLSYLSLVPGTHTPIIDRRLWDRVQTLLGQKVYKQHQMTYASDLIECAHCGSPITGERKFKMTKSGEREYVYYRCTQYHKGDHPRIRLTENELDAQMLAIFDTLRVEDDEFRIRFREELRQATNWDERSSASKAKQLQDELVRVRDQQNRLLNLRMLEEINADTFASKSRELRDREAELKLEIDVADRGRHEIIDIAVKAFELSQQLRSKWVTADYAAKRRILEILCLNCSLDGVSLVATMRKPFDLLAKGLLQKDSRDDRI